ncbi:D-glycero-beta-D-manno-heptose 1,7-bisphosphate 7-phosphatase [bacterium]|nr:D-glycero-beta-D-manno-heptose 1,7-bisphosphate 7-phosphatase [bacterium]
MRVVFLDRDGVINEDRDDYVKNLNELKVFPFTPNAVKKLNDAGFKVHVVSNQQGVAKGLIREEDLKAMQAEITRQVEAVGGKIASFSYCKHLASEKCNCRKPKIGMLLAAASNYNIDLKSSYIIGDSEKDIQAGKAAGCRTILVMSGASDAQSVKELSCSPDYIADNLAKAVDYVIEKADFSLHSE